MPDTNTENKRQARQRANREKLLQVAKTTFTTRGYDGVNMREIAHAAGLSTGAIYTNFNDKADLYEEVFGHPPITPEQGRKLVTALTALGIEPARLLAA